MDAPTTFGDWLQQRRKALGLTREQLAQRVGYSVSGLRKIEAGERRPSLQVAELLANGLGVAPEERPLFLKVARGEMSLERLPSPQPAVVLPNQKLLASPPAPRLNLPTYAAPLVGRQAELAEVGRLLQEPECRLLTLVGPGGIGKTRLAVEVAARQIDSFLHGVCWVPLSGVNDASDLTSTSTVALGVDTSSDQPPRTRLLDFLREKELLLVLDNFEHLLKGATLLTEILGAAPAVKLLVTSREHLQLQAEHICPLSGLPHAQWTTPAEAERDASIQLFLHHARRVRPAFSLQNDHLVSLRTILQLAQGMPLALILAAGWVEVLSPAQIAAEIDRSLDFWETAQRDVPARQRSMRAVFAGTWARLNEREQARFAALSVFQGGFTLEAARAVADASPRDLRRLVDCSLLTRLRGGSKCMNCCVSLPWNAWSREGRQRMCAMPTAPTTSICWPASCPI